MSVEVELAFVAPKVVGVNQVPTPSPVAVTVPQTIVPFASVVRTFEPEQAPKFEASVVEPVFEIEKSVVVPVAVDEPIAKRVWLVSPLLAAIENLANGEVEPMPKFPAFKYDGRRGYESSNIDETPLLKS